MRKYFSTSVGCLVWCLVSILCWQSSGSVSMGGEAEATAARDYCDHVGNDAFTEKEDLEQRLQDYTSHAADQWSRRTELLVYEDTLPPAQRYPDSEWAEDVRWAIDIYGSLRHSAADDLYDEGMVEYNYALWQEHDASQYYMNQDWDNATLQYFIAAGYFEEAYGLFTEANDEKIGDPNAYINETHPSAPGDDTAYGHLTYARAILDDVEMFYSGP